MAFTLPSPLETPRLYVRTVEETDIDDLLVVNGDEQVTRYLPYETWRSHADGKLWYDRMCGFMAAGDTLQFVISEKNSARVIGTCLLFRYNEANGRAELGYVMGRDYWNRGYTFEALGALIGYAFESCKMRRLEAEVEPANIASNQLLLKLGFIHEGRLRQRWHTKGNNYDANIYGLLSHEWSPVSPAAS